MFTIWLLLCLAVAAFAVWKTMSLLAQYPEPLAEAAVNTGSAFATGSQRALPIAIAGAVLLLCLGSLLFPGSNVLGWRAASACGFGAFTAAAVVQLAWHCAARLRARTALRAALGGIVAGFGLGSMTVLLLLFGPDGGAAALGFAAGVALVAMFARREAPALLAVDLLLSQTAALLAAVLVGGAVAGAGDNGQLTRLTTYPLIATATGIGACAVAAALTQTGRLRLAVRHGERVTAALLLLAVMALLTWWLAPQPQPPGSQASLSAWNVYLALLIGVLLAPLSGRLAVQSASPQLPPAQELAQHSDAGAPANLLHGLATGMASTWLPVLVLALAAWASSELAGLYGICIMATGFGTMLATSPAFGIREPAVSAADRRARASTAAALTMVAWYAVFAVQSRASFDGDANLTGVLLGAMLPFLLSAMLLRAGAASPDRALRWTLAAAALAVVSPILAGMVFGIATVGGLLPAAIATSVALSLFLRNTAGAFAGAIEYIDKGHVGGTDGPAKASAAIGHQLGQSLVDLPLHTMVVLLMIAAVLALPLCR